MELLNKIYQILNSKEKKNFKILFVISVMSMILETFSISMLVPLLNLVLSDNTDNFFFHIISSFQNLIFMERIDYSTFLLIIIFFVFSIKSLVTVYFIYYKNKFVYALKASLSSRLYEKLSLSEYDYFLKTNSSIIINYLSKEVDEFISLIDSGITFFTETLIILGLLTFVIIYEPLSIYAMIFFALVSYFIYLITRTRIEKWGNIRQFHDSLRATSINEIIDGIKEIKLLQKEEYFLKKFNIHNYGSANIAKKISTVVQLPRILLEFMGVFAIIILIFSLKLYGTTNENTLIIVGILAAISFRVLPSLNRVLNTSQSLKFGKTVVLLIYNLIFDLTQNKKFKSTDKTNIFNDFQNLKVSDLNFSYGSNNIEIIKNLNISINAGEIIGIMGKTGGGKTTLLNILCGIIFPKSGSIKADEINIFEKINDWQKIISYVPQNTFLIDDTVKKNIALGIEDEKIDIEKVKISLEQAGLKSFIENLDNNIETFIGERGIKISGGQKQRIGIARAIYNNSKLLILDEITSSLDEKTEKEIVKEIKKFVPEKTIIMVSHKINTLKYCNRIYEFKNFKLELIQNA